MIKKALSLILVLNTFAAFSQKIAHISFDSLITLMPETVVATDAANKYLKGLETELVAMQSEFETKYKAYLEQENTMGDLLKKTKQDDLQQLQNRIQEFQKKAEMDFRKKQAELTAPIVDKARKGISIVAKEGNYRYVLDSSRERTSILYMEPADDILMAVKKKLDSMPLAQIPGASQPEGIKMPPPANAGKPAGKGK